MSTKLTIPGRFWIVGLLALWFAGVTLGFVWLVRYKSTPGPSADAPADWPTGTALSLARDRPTLVLFLHPHCDCSHATVTELERLLAVTASKPRTYVLFYRPGAFPERWCQTPLFDQASRLIGVTVQLDHYERERRRFGVATSGQVLLYDKRGRLQYNGGITRARGVEGDSPGRRSLLAWLQGSKSTCSPSPVLGCPLVQEGECPCQP